MRAGRAGGCLSDQIWQAAAIKSPGGFAGTELLACRCADSSAAPQLHDMPSITLRAAALSSLRRSGMQEAAGKALVAEAQSVLKGFWGPERLRKLCLSILQHYLPLTVRPLHHRQACQASRHACKAS